MSKISTIVSVVDLSAASRQSLPLAVKLAKDKGSKLVVVYPVPFRHWSIYSIFTYNPQRETAAAAQRAEPFVREIMNRAPGVEWELKVESGNPDVIIDQAAQESAAELVVSARHRGRLDVLKSSVEASEIAAYLKAAKPEPSIRPTVLPAGSH